MGNNVALTFDDGPHPEFTLPVLDTLSRHGVVATFFVVGEYVERHPEVMDAIVAAGHEVGNHTFHHNLVNLPEQIQRTEHLLQSHGVQSRLYRPPYGRLSARHLAWTVSHGYSTVMWSHDTRDSLRADGKERALETVDEIISGDIVLMHDDNSVCVQELEALLVRVARSGLRFVRLSELA